MAYEPKYGDVEIKCPKCGKKRWVQKRFEHMFVTCIECTKKFNQEMCRMNGHQFDFDGFQLVDCFRCHQPRSDF